MSPGSTWEAATPRFAGVVGTAVTRICATEVSRTGLNEREARDAAFEFVTATVDSTTTASYFADVPTITVKLLAERRSGRIIGAQIVGGRGAGKRIDVAAAAITAGMDAEQLVDLDFGYAPPGESVVGSDRERRARDSFEALMLP